MAFSLNLNSVDGYFVGRCMPAGTLSDATIGGAPQESTSDMPLWSLRKDGSLDSSIEWRLFYHPALNQAGELASIYDFYNYLTNNGYGFNNKLPVCVFDVVDGQGTNTGIQLCLMAYSAGSNNITYQMQKRTLSQGVYTYTNVSNARTVNTFRMTDFGMVCGVITKLGKQWYSFGFATYYSDYTAEADLFGNTTEGLTALLGGTVPGDATSPEFGPASEPGGGYNEDTPSSGKGSFDNTSDTITPSSKPTLTPLSSNLVHAYKVNVQTLNNIADAIYVDLANDWSSIETALEAIYNAIFAAKYVDFLLDLLILPINVPAPNLVDVKVGGKYLTLSSGRVQSYLVTDPYVDFDCGSITIPEYWANFLDYTGTKVKLFLPYIGYVDIQPEYVINGELSVRYRFNVLDGSFIVHVLSTSGKSQLEESMIGQYAGVAAVHVPLQASDYATKVSGLISAIGTVAAGMAAGGVGTMAGAANLGNTLMQKPGSTHANGYNASSSYLSHRCPYLIIERQVSQFSQKYMEEVGLPLNVMRTLGSMSGLTKCEAAHLDTIPCSVEGKERISQLMRDGIIL